MFHRQKDMKHLHIRQDHQQQLYSLTSLIIYTIVTMYTAITAVLIEAIKGYSRIFDCVCDPSLSFNYKKRTYYTNKR